MVLISGCVTTTTTTTTTTSTTVTTSTTITSTTSTTTTEVTTTISDRQPFIDDKVVNALENQTEVEVIVKLRKDNFTDFSYMSVEERKAKREWTHEIIMREVDDVQDKVIPFLTESEFRLTTKFELSPSFYGYITKEGLEKLKNNPLVESIYLNDGISHTALDEIPEEITTTSITSTTTAIEEPEDRGWVFTDENRECIIEKQKKFGSPGSYVSGEIYVRFNAGISELEAKNLVKSYGVNPVDSLHARTDNSYFIVVDVPKGLELHWICEFEKSNSVQYSILINMGGLA